jgi:hypothetical protein
MKQSELDRLSSVTGQIMADSDSLVDSDPAFTAYLQDHPLPAIMVGRDGIETLVAPEALTRA